MIMRSSDFNFIAGGDLFAVNYQWNFNRGFFQFSEGFNNFNPFW